MRIMAGSGSGETSYGAGLLGAAALFFAVVLLPIAWEDDTSSPLGNSSSVGGAGAVPTGTPRAGSEDAADGGDLTGSGGVPTQRVPTPTAVRDPVAEAFAAAARVGTCVRAYKTGFQDGAQWNAAAPEVVGCSTDSAFARVAGVNSDCPRSDGGYASWTYGNVSLCLERQFQEGQCFLVSREGGTDSRPVYSAHLFTWVDCDAQRIPADFDSYLVITGVYRAPDPVPDGACRRSAYDRNLYWSWVTRQDTTLVCATPPAN